MDTVVPMYMPAAFKVEDQAEVVAAVTSRGFGHLVVGIDGELDSAPMPFIVRRAPGPEPFVLTGHLAKSNPVVGAADSSALMIVPGPDTYVSPGWYPSKADDGRVVPTWNYEVIHLHGTLRIIDDPGWLRALVTELTDRFEAPMNQPWAVTDTPEEFIDRQLKAITGVELVVERVEAKRKLSQNRTDADRSGVIDGLATSPHPGAAALRAAMVGK